MTAKNSRIFQSKEDFLTQYRDACETFAGKGFEELNDQERYYVLASLVASKAKNVRAAARPEGTEVYYFSLEFLIGPLLDNYLLNFGVRDIVEEGCNDLGTPLDRLLSQEVDPGLGNGGLGRLAACFMDSMAALGINGNGNGMRYRYGLCKQVI